MEENQFSVTLYRGGGQSPPKEEGKIKVSVYDWFDQHQQSFYFLGWSYLRNQQQMEELFYRSIIRVQKELPRFKRETSFEMWVTSIFIHICRELSNNKSLQVSEEREQHKDLFTALDQLKEDEKEAIILSYIKGISRAEVAEILQVSIESMKELLFSGIQSLKKEWGNESAENGCKEYQKDYIDYLERTLDRPKKIDLEKHIFHCEGCQEDLAAFQDVMVNLTERIEDFHVPSEFMENIKYRLADKENHKQQKNRKLQKRILIFGSVLALFMGVGFFTGAFRNLYYSWTEENPELRAFLQHDLGKKLNLEVGDNGVKIRIKGAIADNVQTLIFYEIDDTKGKGQYMMSDDGVFVENERDIMGSVNSPRDYPPDLKSKVNKEKKNRLEGKISLPPLKKNHSTIKLKITKLQKLVLKSSKQKGYMANGNILPKIGKWSFKIPITKQPSINYVLNKEVKIEGVPIRFEKLTVAPTATILQYQIINGLSKKQINGIDFANIEVNHQKIKFDMYTNAFLDSQQNEKWNTRQACFDPLFGKKPKEINVHLNSAYLTIEGQTNIELDASLKYPQTFAYAGSTIYVDKVEDGKPAVVVIRDNKIKNRKYESLQFNITREGGNETISEERSTDGVIVDKNGKEYDVNKVTPNQKIEKPRYFTTVQTIKLDSISGEKVIPKGLEITGYNTTKYLDDVVKIPLK